MKQVLEKVCLQLEKATEKKEAFSVFAGFDGFVDTLVKPIRSSGMDGELEFFDGIADFGSYLRTKAGKSCSLELHRIVEKIGGNAPIYASAISGMGAQVNCVGTFGYPVTQEIFHGIGEKVKLISISNPGKCTALEFNDGKVMLGENDGINDIDYKLLAERLGEETLYRMFASSDMISMMNWSEVPGTTKIWLGILENILPRLPKASRKRMFIDISDCSRRTAEEIREMTDLLERFSDYCDVTLSLNKNEFEIVCGAIGLESGADEIETPGMMLCEKCGLKQLIVHLVDGAYAFTENGTFYAPNCCVKEPVISTGGGDNFNAGLSFGILLEMDIRSAMIMANAVSGFYVTYGHSPSLEEVLEYVRDWKEKL